MSDLAWFIAGMGVQGLLMTAAVGIFPRFFHVNCPSPREKHDDAS
jgi:hypothetical protein